MSYPADDYESEVMRSCARGGLRFGHPTRWICPQDEAASRSGRNMPAATIPALPAPGLLTDPASARLLGVCPRPEAG